MTDEDTKRQSIVEACRKMNSLGINQGTSGNISVRHSNGIFLTPSGIPYDELTPDLIVDMRFDGTWTGPRKPSTEWRFHLDIIRLRSDVNAVVHCHPTYSTILSIMGRFIPAIHYMIAVAGGSTIRCAPYATFGTEQLSTLILEALRDRTACLLGHHGLVATGSSLAKALWLAVEVETLAHQYHGCLQLGTPPLLSDEEIAIVLQKFGNYGLQTPEQEQPSGTSQGQV